MGVLTGFVDGQSVVACSEPSTHEKRERQWRERTKRTTRERTDRGNENQFKGRVDQTGAPSGPFMLYASIYFKKTVIDELPEAVLVIDLESLPT